MDFDYIIWYMDSLLMIQSLKGPEFKSEIVDNTETMRGACKRSWATDLQYYSNVPNEWEFFSQVEVFTFTWLCGRSCIYVLLVTA